MVKSLGAMPLPSPVSLVQELDCSCVFLSSSFIMKTTVMLRDMINGIKWTDKWYQGHSVWHPRVQRMLENGQTLPHQRLRVAQVIYEERR